MWGREGVLRPRTVITHCLSNRIGIRVQVVIKFRTWFRIRGGYPLFLGVGLLGEGHRQGTHHHPPRAFGGGGTDTLQRGHGGVRLLALTSWKEEPRTCAPLT